MHGLQYFSWDWLPVAQALGDEREVLCMDMRGFGDSDWSAQKDYSVPSMVQDIVAVLDHVDWQRVILLGHSMGGRSTTYAAAKHPARVAGLALIDYTPDNAPAGAKRTTEVVGNTPDTFPSLEAARMYLGPKKSVERYSFYLKDENGRFSTKRDPHFRDQFRKVLAGGERPKLGVEMWQLIGEVRCPILSVRGKRSDMYAPETVAKMKAANPRLEVVEVDSGHDVAGDNEKALVEELRKWLSRL
ncbi:MAG TPA: alpha/beta hydrolase [Burkholderiales bacterium]|nr:alpha/beta hydrolase [Burkholderiales bacterium]